MEVEQQPEPEQQFEVDMGNEDQGPPLPDATSFVQLSSSSSEGLASQGHADNEAVSSVPLTLANVAHPVPPLGEGLLNILQAYSADEDSEEPSVQPDRNDPSLASSESQGMHLIEDSLFLPDNVQLVPPNEAHLQLTLGRVQTHFLPIPEEHDLTRRMSSTGILLWQQFFAPHLHGADKSSKPIVDIPVSWFNFVTLMLATPEKFDWAKHFLSSQLWDILKEPMITEDTIQFVIPDSCVTSKAPICITMSGQDEGISSPAPTDGPPSTPKRKRREAKGVLVESEVRRSPRLVLLNEGFKSHANCSDKHCLTCNAAPPMINPRVVKNLAISFCKVPEDIVDKKILKKNKVSGGDNNSTVTPGVIGQKKTCNVPTTSKAKPIEKKGKNKPAAMEQLAKKKTAN
jgi:hypothetical protein